MRTLRGSSVEWTARTEEVPLRELIAVPVDVGKSSAMVMACDFTGRVLLSAVEFPLTRAGVGQMLARVQAAVPAGAQLVRVGVEAAGHYHRPLTTVGSGESCMRSIHRGRRRDFPASRSIGLFAWRGRQDGRRYRPY